MQRVGKVVGRGVGFGVGAGVGTGVGRRGRLWCWRGWMGPTCD